MTQILIMFHCESNPGFAASSHEKTFYKMAKNIVGDTKKIHFSYKTLENGMSPDFPKDVDNIIQFDSACTDRKKLQEIERYIKINGIDIIFGFDLPVRRPAYKYFRRGGVNHIISYWGAPMSSPNSGLKLFAKKVDTLLARNKPDFFIFQSEGMRYTATHGRGIPKNRTTIVKTGIDTDKYSPSTNENNYYAHNEFQIPTSQNIVFFSGHMEPRKGIATIVKTAQHLIESLDRTDIHFLILGNKRGQEDPYMDMFSGSKTENHITFGGYRDDIPDILRSSTLGFIPSTGWDSFPMSSVEMASTELPLVISDLEGLREAVAEDTGFRFPPGDYKEAAKKILLLIKDVDLRIRMGKNARKRVIKNYSMQSQVNGMESVIRNIAMIPKSTTKQ